MSRVRSARHAIRSGSERLDVNGSAITLGHPRGASGAKLMTILVHAPHARSDLLAGDKVRRRGIDGVAGQSAALVTCATYAHRNQIQAEKGERDEPARGAR